MLNSDIGRKKKGTTHKNKVDYSFRDYFVDYKKNGGTLDQLTFSRIIDKINKYYAEQLSLGKRMKLLSGLGYLEPIKVKKGLFFVDGKLVNNYSIDWGRTKELWREDEEAFKNRIKVKRQDNYNYAVLWDKRNKRVTNISAYKFRPARSLKLKTRENVMLKKADALSIKPYRDIL